MTTPIQIAIRSQIQDSIASKQVALENQLIISQIGALANICLSALRSGGKIIFAGNGESFADAQHLSAEFTSRFLFDRAFFASLALGRINSASAL
jgi:D-sedoheptulose 7-phosphate isomerase